MMQFRWILVCVGLVMSHDAEAEQDIVTQLGRATIVVSDADVSKRFYTYGLGYEVLADRVIDRTIVKDQMNLDHDRSVRFVILRSSNIINGRERAGAQLGLIQIGNPAAKSMTRPAGEIVAAGEVMFATRTTDILKVERRMKEMGATFMLERMVVSEQQELVVWDPDGVRIHVVERPDMLRLDGPGSGQNEGG